MKVCHCTLPTIHGVDICNNCGNNIDIKENANITPRFNTVSMLKELAKLRGKDEDHYLTDEEKS